MAIVCANATKSGLLVRAEAFQIGVGMGQAYLDAGALPAGRSWAPRMASMAEPDVQVVPLHFCMHHPWRTEPSRRTPPAGYVRGRFGGVEERCTPA